MSKYGFRVEIWVNYDGIANDSDIGLVNNKFTWGAGGVIDPLSDGGMKKGILARNFCSAITKSTNVKRSGDIANVGGLSLSIDNTEKFWIKFIDAFGSNASFHGSKVVISEVTWSGTAYVFEHLFQGYADLPSFDKSTYILPVRGASEVRNAKIGVVINEDTAENVDPDAISQIIPISYGEIKKAKLLEYIEKDDLLISTSSDPENLSSYPFAVEPIVFGDYINGIRLALGNQSLIPLNDYVEHLQDALADGTLFVKIVSGLGEGQSRKVTAIGTPFNSTTGGEPIVECSFTLDHPLTDNIYSLTSSGGDTLSFASFYSINSTYTCDYDQCKSFLDENFNEINNGLDLFVEDKGFKKIPSFALNTDLYTGTPDSTEITLQPNLFDSDPNKVKSFEVYQDYPLEFDNGGLYLESGYTYNSSIEAFLWDSSTPLGSITNLVNNIGDTSTQDGSIPFEWGFDAIGNNGTSWSVIKSTKLQLPSSPISNFEEVFLNLDLSASVGVTNFTEEPDFDIFVRVKKAKWPNFVELVYESQLATSGGDEEAEFDFDNFPYNYNANGLSDDDFWKGNDFEGNDLSKRFKQVRGYNKIPLGFSSYADMQGFTDIYLEVEIRVNGNGLVNVFDASFNNRINSAGFSFVYSTDIDKAVYTNLNGRIWTDNYFAPLFWLGGNPVDNTIAMLGNVKMHQDFSNEGLNYANWGKFIPPEAIDYINLNVNDSGSYYHQDLDEYGYYGTRTGTQILKSSDSDTKSISRKMCQSMFLTSWVNNDGLECVAQLPHKSFIEITTSISFDQMISVSSRTEMDSRDIFCEPFVNYNKDYSGDKYFDSAKITSVGEALTDAQKINAVKGLDSITDNQKIELWAKARALFEYYGVLNTPPTNLSNNDYITDEAGAYWYLTKWLRFMGARTIEGQGVVVVPRNFLDFTIPYEVGRELDVGSRIYVQVPNITDNIRYEAFVYSISKNISADMPTISLKVVLYDLETETITEWQDTFNVAEDNIQDVTNELEDNVQDT